jgi:hypothetical protein
VSFGISALVFGPLAAIGQSYLLQRYCPRCAQTYDIVEDDGGSGGGATRAVDGDGHMPQSRCPIAKGGLEQALDGHSTSGGIIHSTGATSNV